MSSSSDTPIPVGTLVRLITPTPEQEVVWTAVDGPPIFSDCEKKYCGKLGIITFVLKGSDGVNRYTVFVSEFCIYDARREWLVPVERATCAEKDPAVIAALYKKAGVRDPSLPAGQRLTIEDVRIGQRVRVLHKSQWPVPHSARYQPMQDKMGQEFKIRKIESSGLVQVSRPAGEDMVGYVHVDFLEPVVVQSDRTIAFDEIVVDGVYRVKKDCFSTLYMPTTDMRGKLVVCMKKDPRDSLLWVGIYGNDGLENSWIHAAWIERADDAEIAAFSVMRDTVRAAHNALDAALRKRKRE